MASFTRYCSGVSADRREVRAYAPGHAWEGWQLAEHAAKQANLKLADAKPKSALRRITPPGKSAGQYEVWVFVAEEAD